MCTRNLIRIYDLDRNSYFFANCKTIDEAKKLYSKLPVYRIEKLPCGQCMECRLEYAKTWAFRCMQESKYHENNIMMTLTYNDENVPKGQKIDTNTGEVYGESLVLKHKDVQDFLKRLRKNTKQKFKYYMCGEYGDLRDRPHYHIICFGLKVDDLVPYKKKKTEYGTHLLYKSKTIDKIWGMGFVDLNEVTFETCAYVARYVTKKQKGKLSKEFYDKKGLIPEYTQMSKGIGKSFYYENKEKFANEEDIYIKTARGVQTAKPGRYFDKLMEKEDPERLEIIKKHRKERSKEILEQILSQTTLTESEYQEQKDYITNNKIKKLKRSF